MTTRRISPSRVFVLENESTHAVVPQFYEMGDRPYHHHREAYPRDVAAREWWLVQCEDIDRKPAEFGPNQWWWLTDTPPRTNSTHEMRETGWLGTTNNVREHAHGRVSVAWGADGRLRCRSVPSPAR